MFSGRALNKLRWGDPLDLIKLRMANHLYKWSQTVGAKLHWSKGKQPWSPSKVPKSKLSVKSGETTETTRRLA